MKAYIVNKWFTMLGDIYSEVYSSYKTFRYLQQLGYEVSINWEKNNLLYSNELPLSLIIDQSYCSNIVFHQLEEINSKFIHVPQHYNKSFLIYVSEIHEELKNYKSLIWNCHEMSINPHLFPLTELPDERQFLSSSVLEIGKKFLQGRDNIQAVNFRFNDGVVLFSISELQKQFPDLFKRLYKYLENTNNPVLICSNSQIFVDYVLNKYSHTFRNNFTFSDIKHVWSYERTRADEDYVLHTQEIAAEMYCFSQCKEILRLSTLGRPTNFLSYGLVHNIHHTNWNDRLNKLFI